MSLRFFWTLICHVILRIQKMPSKRNCDIQHNSIILPSLTPGSLHPFSVSPNNWELWSNSSNISDTEGELSDWTEKRKRQDITVSQRERSSTVHRRERKLIDCSQPSVFSYFYWALNARIESRKNWTLVQIRRLEWVGVRTEKNLLRPQTSPPPPPASRSFRSLFISRA